MPVEKRCEHVIISSLRKVNEQIAEAQTTLAERQEDIERLESMRPYEVLGNDITLRSDTEVTMNNVSSDTQNEIKKLLIVECKSVISLTRRCIHNLMIDVNKLTNEWRDSQKIN